ncbi:MAG: HAMP domain-containing histidine kinase [Desulfobacula sp.]|jgi:two-component system, OmpR family, sensor kinase|uniref:sensor histidine kinase n=1 Tax=Desulfobacula sp. TaxID=2593537 RepID=UPI001D955DC0|nr:HAMP domain-containing histidine kinase [Desulfobacula sp.]MBT3484038.1 HAMP domain-containing histidine kinase [Desulfobacula sp.]MBT3805980.1 HAMP domain-containing histidine kinase [Desulfobacula sp.]MBT4026335.1 HAMP domain-containing histidine kinase [Desulfobacula sp.]MBT4198120.1 HAMP domain-containing histidine kinase [Desulfobacula sp.]
MKIRKKITLWISGTALLSTIIFSSIIFFELMEEPFKFIDKEMQYMTEALAEKMKAPTINNDSYDLSGMPYNPDKYWIKVTDNSEKILYQSKITHYTDIPPSGNKTTYMVEKVIPRSQIWLGQDKEDDVLFRVLVTKGQLNQIPIEIRIAKPIEDLEEELIQLVRYISISLFICTLIIIFISYKLSGKILNPIVSITRMSKEISEKSLHQRIPLNRNKDELYDLSISLNKMFDRLQYSFQRQKEFIGNASHELKSPITLLMLAQEEMLMNEDLSSPASKGLMRQLDTTRRMSHLVRNLLDLSRLEQQSSSNREPVDMAALTNKVLNDYTDLFAAKNISLQNKMPKKIVFKGDQEKLVRLLINLIDNSIRYNFEKNGVVIVKGKETDRGINLEISNTGRMIPEEELELVFEQFYRVEKSRSINHGGSGLGLAIAKKIVELHSGTIAITNESDNFIKISVILPF